VAEFLPNKEQNEDACRHSNRQTENVDERIYFVSANVANEYGNLILDHRLRSVEWLGMAFFGRTGAKKYYTDNGDAGMRTD
jgi:hypothetical protein